MATLQAKSIRCREDERLLTGKGNDTADGRRDGMLEAVLVRSPHASVGAIDTDSARAMPGVVRVYTAADFADAAIFAGVGMCSSGETAIEVGAAWVRGERVAAAVPGLAPTPGRRGQASGRWRRRCGACWVLGY
jgi:CO/xanthine dehydrogenase Mo-binding subunit